MQKGKMRIAIALFFLLVTSVVLSNGKEFSGVFDSDGRRLCAVGQSDEVRLMTNTMTLECLRSCDDNPECVVFNLYDNTTCEIFTCSSKSSLDYQIVESCKSFRVNDIESRCSQPECAPTDHAPVFGPAAEDAVAGEKPGSTRAAERGIHVQLPGVNINIGIPRIGK